MELMRRMRAYAIRVATLQAVSKEQLVRKELPRTCFHTFRRHYILQNKSPHHSSLLRK
jgi:hypothetical protein